MINVHSARFTQTSLWLVEMSWWRILMDLFPFMQWGERERRTAYESTPYLKLHNLHVCLSFCLLDSLSFSLSLSPSLSLSHSLSLSIPFWPLWPLLVCISLTCLAFSLLSLTFASSSSTRFTLIFSFSRFCLMKDRVVSENLLQINIVVWHGSIRFIMIDWLMDGSIDLDKWIIPMKETERTRRRG